MTSKINWAKLRIKHVKIALIGIGFVFVSIIFAEPFKLPEMNIQQIFGLFTCFIGLYLLGSSSLDDELCKLYEKETGKRW